MFEKKALATLVAMLSELGPYFTLTANRHARPITDLYVNSDGALDRLVTSYAGKLRTTEHRVAASILFQEFAARLWSPVLGSIALGRPPPDLAADRLGWLDEPFSLNLTHDAAGAEPSTIIDGHLRPMATAMASSPGVATDLLWGNAASALVGTMTVLRINGKETETTKSVVRELLATEPLRSAGVLDDEGNYRRRSCCLYYRVPGGGLCGDCGLTSKPGGRRGFRSG